MSNYINARVFSKKELSLKCQYTDSTQEFCHFSLEKEIPKELIKINPLIKVLDESELVQLTNDPSFTKNHDVVQFSGSFADELLDFSVSLFEKFKNQTIDDLANIEEMINNEEDHDIISKEFHRLKSTFATFGFEFSRKLIEEKQKKSSIYVLEDVYAIKFSFEKDIIAINHFYEDKGVL